MLQKDARDSGAPTTTCLVFRETRAPAMAVIAKITNPETTTAIIEAEKTEEVEKPPAAEASEENEV